MTARIEVATTSATGKQKGDLLEKLAAQLLRTQHYAVQTQVRITATELDLLCRHKVNNRAIYVECKAYRDPLSADPLKKILGTIDFHDHDEGWLISAGPLGKDAKGFQIDWENKSAEKRQRLSIYTPERVISALADASVIVAEPTATAEKLVGHPAKLGDWTLLITEFGNFWAANCLEGGIPSGVLVFEAESGDLVKDISLLRNLSKTDSSLNQLDFEYGIRNAADDAKRSTLDVGTTIVQVKHAETWDDYRPARPEHFVGRQEVQQRLLKFLDAARRQETRTRVFAVTGDTGMGKSSLIAKLRSRTASPRLRNRIFMYAVDVRAASGPSYILGSLVACIKAAIARGFGTGDADEILISDHSDPLASPSIQAYLRTLGDGEQAICIVFDQFEELYSKPDLFPVFEEAQKLFLSAAASSSNLVIGFVLRSDSTVQQNHPAYYMWHKLADHRYEVRLLPFSHREVCSAVTLFEKELGQRLRPELRRQVIENSEGYPWLLKKLCIHLFEQISNGADQATLDETMDVRVLFERDLHACTQAERTCLQLIAKQSPADWYEILEACGPDVVRSLQDKRLIIRSGDRLNVYWDVFREYVLSGTAPSIPFTYLCSSPSVGAFLSAASRLSKDVPTSAEHLSKLSGLSVKTLGNVIHDLVMFGIASGNPTAVVLDKRLRSANEHEVLERLRVVMKRHALTRRLSRFEAGSVITIRDMVLALKEINPSATHRHNTWEMYAERLGPWFVAAGLLHVCSGGWSFKDEGKVCVPSKRGSRVRLGCFLGDAPPLKVVQSLAWLAKHQPTTASDIYTAGFRNAVRVLDRLDLTARDDDGRYIVVHDIADEAMAAELVLAAAAKDETLLLVWDHLKRHPSASGVEIGKKVSEDVDQRWSEKSQMRTGNALRHWAIWTGNHIDQGLILNPPGPRVRKQDAKNSHIASLFD